MRSSLFMIGRAVYALSFCILLTACVYGDLNQRLESSEAASRKNSPEYLEQRKRLDDIRARSGRTSLLIVPGSPKTSEQSPTSPGWFLRITCYLSEEKDEVPLPEATILLEASGIKSKVVTNAEGFMEIPVALRKQDFIASYGGQFLRINKAHPDSIRFKCL